MAKAAAFAVEGCSPYDGWTARMSPEDRETLFTIAEVAVAFAGFAINGDNTKFDHTQIKAQFLANTVEGAEAITTVTIAAATGITDLFIGSANITYVGCNAAGDLVQQATPFTCLQRRTIAPLGNIGHPDQATITTVFAFVAYIMSPVNQIHDIMRALGPISNGNDYSAAASDLTISKTAGRLTGMGLGFDDDKEAPNTRQVGALTPVTSMLHVLRDGTNSLETEIDPSQWDNDGVLESVPSNRFTIQVIVMFAGGFTNVLWGQEHFATLDNAKTHLAAYTPVIPDVVLESAVARCTLIVDRDATDLSDPTEAFFHNLGPLGTLGL
jgi:hypothetical protein